MIGSLQATLTKEQCEIIRAALYFDIFKYPLTEQELFENSAIHITKSHFLEELNGLISTGFLKRMDGFISCLERTPEDLQRRLVGNAGARNVMPLAFDYSRRISRFPFVEGICLSGGLSKNYFDANSDVDFFIITKPGRLWICRTLLILRYKLLPKNFKKYWCTNYFISSDNLAILDINVFTATELAFLIPTVNHSLYQQVLDSNTWYKDRFPNKVPFDAGNSLPNSRNSLKSSLEWLLSGAIGNSLDNLLLRLTLTRWRNKYPNLKEQDFELQFRSRKDVCKRHTLGFQNRVLVQWEEKTKEFEERYSVKIS